MKAAHKQLLLILSMCIFKVVVLTNISHSNNTHWFWPFLSILGEISKKRITVQSRGKKSHLPPKHRTYFKNIVGR